MDMGNGTFRPVSEQEAKELPPGSPAHQFLFRVGEEVAIKGIRFVVKKFTRKDIVLRLLSRGGA